jgi:hypothetical protein
VAHRQDDDEDQRDDDAQDDQLDLHVLEPHLSPHVGALLSEILCLQTVFFLFSQVMCTHIGLLPLILVCIKKLLSFLLLLLPLFLSIGYLPSVLIVGGQWINTHLSVVKDLGALGSKISMCNSRLL